MKFWRIALIRPPIISEEFSIHPRQIHPPLSLKYIEELLSRKGYVVKLIDCWIEHYNFYTLCELLLSWSPDILVVSTFNYNYHWVEKLTSSLKRRKNIISIVIGPDVSISPRRYIYKGSLFDIGVKGEPEMEVPNLIDELNVILDTQKIIDKYSQKMDFDPTIIDDLDALPFPRYTEKEIKKYRFLYPLPFWGKTRRGFIISSRGCPHECKFCSYYIRKSFGKKVRFRSSQNIIDEIEYLKGLRVNMISFEDDDFTLSAEHVNSICEELLRRKIDIRWCCQARLDELDSNLLHKMKRAGCILIVIGVESGSIKVLRELNKFTFPKEALEKGITLLKEMEKLNISSHLLFMVGSPYEDIIDLEKTLNLVKELSPSSIQLHFFTPYPDSFFYYKFKEKINSEVESQIYHYAFPLVNLSAMPKDILKNSYFNFYFRFYFNLKFIFRHICKYSLFYLFNPDIFIRLANIALNIQRENDIYYDKNNLSISDT